MSFWSESYGFIKDVYDTRVHKMIEWMDHLEMAIAKVMASKVYTSAEFRRERDNFLSLCKNLEKGDTKKWLTEVRETLFRDRNQDEKKDEFKRLEQVLERHQNLMPKVKDTQLKSEVFWRCYEYGDDLIQIFEFLDDQRAKSVREIIIGDAEATEEFQDKHASIMRIMENKKKTVEEFIAKGERLMEDPKSPKFLETHVSKLKEAWDLANEKANERKKDLAANLESWKTFDTKKVECAKTLDSADSQLKSIKKNYNIEKGPAELADKMKIAAAMRYEIEDLFNSTDTANNILQKNLPLEMKDGMNAQVKVLKDRLQVLENMDRELANIFQFNQQLKTFDETLTKVTEWITGKAQDKLKMIRSPDDEEMPPDPEEKVGKVLELSEDLAKRNKICLELEETRETLFPKEGEKMSKDAKSFLERLKFLRTEITTLEENLQKEFERTSKDVRYFAEYQTGLQEFLPKLMSAESRIMNEGLKIPGSLVEARANLEDSQKFASDLEETKETLEGAFKVAQGLTCHAQCDKTVIQCRDRWLICHQTVLGWIDQLTELEGTWAKLDGNINDLASTANTEQDIPIEKIEEQLTTLKLSFKEKQKLVQGMEDSSKISSTSGMIKKDVPNLNLRRMTVAPTDASRRKLSAMISEKVEEKVTEVNIPGL